MTNIAIENLSPQLADLLKEVRLGEEVLFTEHNKPIARLVPINSTRRPRKAGSASHLPHHMADDFNSTTDGFEEYMP